MAQRKNGQYVCAAPLRWAVLTALAAAICSSSLWAQSADIYTCVDNSGRKLTADRPIPECFDREQRVLNPSGTLKNTIGPRLSERDKQALEAKRRVEEEERQRIEDQKRRDKALLTRYPDQASHDRERQSAVEQTLEVKRLAGQKLLDLQSERALISQELEFYVQTPERTPGTLVQRAKSTDQAMDVQRKLIEEQDRQLKRINTNFDEELKRLKTMWQQATAQTR